MGQGDEGWGGDPAVLPLCGLQASPGRLIGEVVVAGGLGELPLSACNALCTSGRVVKDMGVGGWLPMPASSFPRFPAASPLIPLPEKPKQPHWQIQSGPWIDFLLRSGKLCLVTRLRTQKSHAPEVIDMRGPQMDSF